MNIELVCRLDGQKLNIWKSFLASADLTADTDVEQTVLLWEGSDLIGTGSRKENLLKCIAVDSARQGEGLTATIITALRQDAFEKGYRHLFLYTKPKNELMFSSLFFYPIAKTEKVLLMENVKGAISDFLSSLPDGDCASAGAMVMNCNPFTLGHRHLIKTASENCERLYVFVLSEDKSRFSFESRFAMVKEGVADLENVTVLPTGPYLISSATFPSYFLKDNDNCDRIHCALDIEIFVKYFAPKFKITKRFVGTEPFCRTTSEYNRALKELLPPRGIELCEIPRLEANGTPISASAVRRLLDEGDLDGAKKLVPETTIKYLL